MKLTSRMNSSSVSRPSPLPSNRFMSVGIMSNGGGSPPIKEIACQIQGTRGAVRAELLAAGGAGGSAHLLPCACASIRGSGAVGQQTFRTPSALTVSSTAAAVKAFFVVRSPSAGGFEPKHPMVMGAPQPRHCVNTVVCKHSASIKTKFFRKWRNSLTTKSATKPRLSQKHLKK